MSFDTDEVFGRSPMPDWVRVYRWARKMGETRFFPQQAPALVSSETTMTMEEYGKIRNAYEFTDNGGAPQCPEEQESLERLAGITPTASTDRNTSI